MDNVLLITTDGEELFGEITIDEKVYFTQKKVSNVDYIITPTFFNSHVHLGDSVAKDPEFMRLEQLVGPNGFKFSVLKRANEKDVVASIKKSIETALECGTSNLADFREGGTKGLELLKKADTKNVCVKLARPSNIEEAELMECIDGFGLSSTRDHDFSFLEELRDFAKRKKLLFAIHAGERDDDDVERALSLNPDLIVHMNMASIKNLKRAIDEAIPIVSCPKSNVFFDLFNRKNYSILSNYNLWLMGTDNVMISTPCMLSEINFASYLIKKDKEIFRAAVRGFNVFKRHHKLIVFHTKGNLYKANSLRSVVRRANVKDILQIIEGELLIE